MVHSLVKSHYDNDGDIFPEFGNGNDSFTKAVPTGKKLSHFRLRKLTDSSPLSHCDMADFPTVGATGTKVWKTTWDYPVFGKIKYALEIWATPSGEAFSPVQVIHGENGWAEFAHQLVKQKRKFKIILRNDVATYLWRALNRLTGSATRPTANAVGETVVITLGIAAAVVSIVALSVFGIIFVSALNNGYNVSGKFISGPDGPLLEITASNTTNN